MSLMRIQRIYDDLERHIAPNKVLVLYGPRQVGKTTILQSYLSGTRWRYRLEIGDDIHAQEIIGSHNLDWLTEYAEGYELIAIDEAQRIPNVGQGLKILVDNIPGIRIIVTGSSSFELSGQVGEPLTGRKKTLVLYPLSQFELRRQHSSFDLKKYLENHLVFGSFPEVLTARKRSEKIDLVTEIVGSYLLKDILELDRVKSSKILLDLLRLLAFQVGKEVSLRELATQLGIDYKTVARYIDLLEKSFVLYNLRGYSRNLRKEITKKSKYYFCDNGIRNGIISNFNALSRRDDLGALWENFLVSDRLKLQAYKPIHSNNYFWRTWDQKEIDFVEEREGKLYGFEFKWGTKKISPPREWLEAYPEGVFSVVDRDNYLDFLT
jgi:predicted AAA+ superfamily ATPase